MFPAVISSCWKQTCSISQSGEHHKPWQPSQSPCLHFIIHQIVRTAASRPSPLATPAISEAMTSTVPTTPPSSNLLELPTSRRAPLSEGYSFSYKAPCEKCIFVSANTKAAQNVGPASDRRFWERQKIRGRDAASHPLSARPSVSAGRMHYHSTAWLLGASEYKSLLNSPDSRFSSLYQGYQSTLSMKGFLWI